MDEGPGWPTLLIQNTADTTRQGLGAAQQVLPGRSLCRLQEFTDRL